MISYMRIKLLENHCCGSVALRFLLVAPYNLLTNLSSQVCATFLESFFFLIIILDFCYIRRESLSLIHI